MQKEENVRRGAQLVALGIASDGLFPLSAPANASSRNATI